jgi:hypothetical protein
MVRYSHLEVDAAPEGPLHLVLLPTSVPFAQHDLETFADQEGKTGSGPIIRDLEAQ